MLIGGSAGSLKVLFRLLPAIKPNIDFPIIIILHRKHDRKSSLELLLNNSCSLAVKEAEDKEMLIDGVVYIAPSDYHLLIEKDYSLSLDASEKIMWSRPSIDVTFQSAADVYGKNLMGIILSGANSDGSMGLLRIKEAGGKTVVQSPENAEMIVMPRAAMELVKPEFLIVDSEMASLINHF